MASIHSLLVVLLSIWKRRYKKFSEIFRRYDELICEFDLHSIQECVDAFLAINQSRHEKKRNYRPKMNLRRINVRSNW